MSIQTNPALAAASANADRPTPYVFRRGDWVNAGDASDITAEEKRGIDEVGGNDDTPTAHALLAQEPFEGTVKWAEGRIASASTIPMLSTFFAGFAIANLFGLDPNKFHTMHGLNVFMFCQSATIALNLHAAVTVAYLCMRSGEWLASDKRVLVDTARREKDNRAYIGNHGEHVASSHALMANHSYLIRNGIKEFVWSIVFYLGAIVALVADQYDLGTLICVAVPLAIGASVLFYDMRQMGMSLMPSWGKKKGEESSVTSKTPQNPVRTG